MNRNKQRNLVTNILISLSYFIFWIGASIVSTQGEKSIFSGYLNTYLWKVLYISLINLLIYAVLIPVLSPRKIKWLIVISLIIPGLAVTILGFYGWNMLGANLSILKQWNNDEMTFRYIVPNTIHIVFGLIYHATIYFVLASVRLHSKNQQLLIEKKVSELNYLKSQTNPHFLFNTLNGIYALAREKSDLTADTVLRLSDILRYMLYETQSELVPIDKEVEIIEDYIELEKIRYDETLKVTFEKKIDNQQQNIPPLLLIHLIENAFKHGASESITKPFILVNLSVINGKLKFTVNNSIVNNDASESVRESIGLANLRRQLSLLFKDYQLNVNRIDNSFFVTLDINLNSYAKN